jgi:hypothetical protein
MCQGVDAKPHCYRIPAEGESNKMRGDIKMSRGENVSKALENSAR